MSQNLRSNQIDQNLHQNMNDLDFFVRPCIMQFMASRGCPNILSYSNFVP